jgi:hypothetical protein
MLPRWRRDAGAQLSDFLVAFAAGNARLDLGGRSLHLWTPNAKGWSRRRCKQFELVEASRRAMRGLPLLARLDGRAFHTFTRDLRRPYEHGMSVAMIETTRHLLQEMIALVGWSASTPSPRGSSCPARRKASTASFRSVSRNVAFSSPTSVRESRDTSPCYTRTHATAGHEPGQSKVRSTCPSGRSGRAEGRQPERTMSRSPCALAWLSFLYRAASPGCIPGRHAAGN